MNRSGCRLCGAEHNGMFEGCPGERPKKTVSNLTGGLPNGWEQLAQATQRQQQMARQQLQGIIDRHQPLGSVPQPGTFYQLPGGTSVTVTARLRERIEACDIKVEDAFIGLVSIVDHLGELLFGEKPSPAMRIAIAKAVLELDQ
jgi:hypothetical protein